MKQDRVPISTEFYREKGFTKSFTVHFTPAVHEALRKYAFDKRLSLQLAVRELVTNGIKKYMGKEEKK